MIRIGIDARELGGHPTGVGRYLREVLLRWQRDLRPQDVAFVLFTPDPDVARRWPSAPHVAWQHVPGDGRAVWEQTSLASAANGAGLDLFFAPAYTAPLRLRMPMVLTLHDVSFAAHPEWFPWRHGLRMRTLARWSARRARRVLTLSQFSASEITRCFGISASRIRPIPLAVDHLDAPPPPAVSSAPSPVVLYVGSVFERRHLPLLIHGVARARTHVPDLRLDVIGENRTSPRVDLAALAEQAGIGSAVRLRDYVTEAELDEAYASAGAFVFLSEYEGWGLTPVEAMRHRLPVVVLDTAVAREVYGDGARFVVKGDADGLAETLVALFMDPAARAAQIAAGDATVARYSWDHTARATWDVLREVAEDSR